MSSSNPAPEQIPPKGKEKEAAGDPPRGRARESSHASRTQHGDDQRSESRSVSRGRTHRRSRHVHGRRDTSYPPPDDYVYPSPGGGFSPKGRPPSKTEAAYLSDAPHLDFKKPPQKRKRAAGSFKSPQPSHIRLEIEAGLEMGGTHKWVGGRVKASKEESEEAGKSEEH